MLPLIWFIIVSSVTILVWRLIVKDKKDAQKKKR